MKILSISDKNKKNVSLTNNKKEILHTSNSGKKVLEQILRVISRLNEIVSPILNEDIRERKLENQLIKSKLKRLKSQYDNILASYKDNNNRLEIINKKIELYSHLANMMKQVSFNKDTLENISNIIEKISDENITYEKLTKIENMIKKVTNNIML